MLDARACLQRVLNGFYVDPDAEVAARALGAALEDDTFASHPDTVLMFVRMAEIHADVEARFRALATELEGRDRTIVEMIVDPPAKFENAAYLPASPSHPAELDVCWGEFLVTGSTESVLRIVEVLDREDVTRTLIDESFASPDSAPLRLSQDEWRSFDELGLPIRVTEEHAPMHVAVPGDVDLLIWNGVQREHAASRLVLGQLDEPQVLHVATKGAALWSLKSNSEQHDRVRELCERESRRAGGAGRSYLT